MFTLSVLPHIVGTTRRLQQCVRWGMSCITVLELIQSSDYGYCAEFSHLSSMTFTSAIYLRNSVSAVRVVPENVTTQNTDFKGNGGLALRG